MRVVFAALALMVLLPLAAMAADVPDISNETELDNALAQAVSGDTLTLDADFTIAAGKAIPDGVVLDGAGFSINSDNNGNGTLINQDGVTGGTVRNLTFTSSTKDGWQIQSRGGGSILFENCTLEVPTIAWSGSTLDLVDSKVDLVFNCGQNANYRYRNVMACYGGTFSATNCFFRMGYENGRQDPTALIHNDGGSSVLSLSACTIYGVTHATPQYGLYSVVESKGTGYTTTVTNSVIVADASSIFRSEGSGTTVSANNCNAGMARNPAYLLGSDVARIQFQSLALPDFYHYNVDSITVSDQSGDVTEWNPFVDIYNEDFRLVSASKAATGSSTGGPMGCDLLGAPVDQDSNGYNLDFEIGETLASSGVDDIFAGWSFIRDSTYQWYYAVPGRNGQGIDLETKGADAVLDLTNGGVFIDSSVYQYVTVPPESQVIVTAWSRRNPSSTTTWTGNGETGSNILAVSVGESTDWTSADGADVINGNEDVWERGQVSVIVPAGENRITIHLVHQSEGTWNLSTWDDVAVSVYPATPPSDVGSSFNLYR